MANNYVYLAVIMSGASVLAIEILGTRLLAPFYGASIYLWSALISITLAALAVGYALGGRLADRGTRQIRLATILGLSGLWILFIPWMVNPLLQVSESLGLRTAVLLSATVLFFIPLMLLGMVSPYAIRLKASSIDVVGRTAGNLYAISTVASVVAALAVGFFLIPYVGVFRLTLLIGILLIVTAVVGFLGRRKVAAVGSILLIGLIALGYQIAPAETADSKKGLLAIEESAYAEIRVVDQQEVRYLLIDKSTQTAASTVTSQTMLPYVNVLDLPRSFFTKSGSLLLIGLGGGSVVRNYSAENWQIDAVDIDPVIIRMAHQFFGVGKNDANIYEMDGRRFLKTSDKTYDLIILDAFGSSYIPFHLMSDEAFELLRSHLNPSGVLAINIWSLGWKDEMVAAVAKTLHKRFSHVEALPLAEPPSDLGNMILLASNRDLTLGQPLPQVRDRFSPEYDRVHAWDNRFEPDTTGAHILTDDLNPMDLWSERLNFAVRKEIHGANARGQVSW